MGRNKPVEFNSKLRKQFHNLVECPITITKRITLLESMESLFECPKFQYEDEDSTILGMRYLLATWEVILSGLNSVKLRDRYVLYRFIVYIANRNEFLLEQNGFDGTTFRLSATRQPLLKRYLYLLKLTLIEAIIIAKDYDNPIQILFSCRILALATFRIPSFGDIVMSALLDLQPPLHLSLPDIRFDVLNDVMNDECFSCSESECETLYETSSVTRSYSYSCGPSTMAVSTDVGVSAEMGVTSDIGVTSDTETDSSSFSEDYYSYYESDSYVDEEMNETPVMVFPFDETIISNHGDPIESKNGDHHMGSRPLDSLRNQQDALPTDLKLSPSVNEGEGSFDSSPLMVIDYSVRVEQMCDTSIHSHSSLEHSQFTSDYPSLFFWCVLADSGVSAGTRSSWYDCFASHPIFTMMFIRCWCDHCSLYHHSIQKPMLYDAIPGYFLILRLFLPMLQSLILRQYHCALTRSHPVMDSPEYVVAVLKASESMLMNPDLINLFIEILFAQCNALIVNDVVSCFNYLDCWMECLRSQSISSLIQIRPSYDQWSIVEMKCLWSLERYLTLHKQSLGFTSHHLSDAFQVCGLLLSDSETFRLLETLVDARFVRQTRSDMSSGSFLYRIQRPKYPLFLESNCSAVQVPSVMNYEYLFEGLKRLLQQEHVIILKRVLLFLYNQFDLFADSYRSQFLLEYLFPENTRLFCHWDQDIRCVYHLFILYKCLQNRRSHLPVMNRDSLLHLLSKEKRRELLMIRHESPISRCFLSHEKWHIKSRISTNEVDRITMMCESRDTIGLYDQTMDSSFDMVIGEKMDSLWKDMLVSIDREQIPVNMKHVTYEAWSEFFELLAGYERVDNQLSVNEILYPPVLDTRLILMEGVVNLME